MGNFKICENCLRDVGCSEEEIAKFTEFKKQNNILGIETILLHHRSQILEDIHKKQSTLGCIDYMLNELNKAKVTS